MLLVGEHSQIAVGRDFDLGIVPASFGPDLIETAQWMAEYPRAKSYRGFYVGACAAAWCTRNEDCQLAFLTGANNSPQKGVPRDCAEMGILRQADVLINYGYRVSLLDLYVAGPSNPELIKEVTGKATPTLHPCPECRDLLQGHQSVSDDMRVTTFGKGGTPVEQQEWGGLRVSYREVLAPPSSEQCMKETARIGGVVLQHF